MASINPLEFNDDNDEDFDWEAAVREIDAACQNTISSASLQTENFPKFGSETNKRAVFTKQSTLDKFMGTTSLRTENQQSNCDRFAGTTSLKTENLQSNGDRFIGTTSLRTENRQSNGDRFIGTTSRQMENESARDENQYMNEADERASGVKIDPEAAKTWIYPANYNLRDYQFNISQAALFSNTLVVLPTGLGKTLIAAVVMYNYFRWFPEGKIVFAAPSRPLVTQQIKACHEIVGIPQEWTIEMTGQISPLRRADLWKDKRVFFLTPQVLEKDIQSGICLAKQLVCLVIDEAHRASGNYAYCVAVRELMAVPVQLRILALSATPGSKQQEIQQVIDTLQISRLEYRSESDDDVKQYVHDKTVDLITVAMDSKAVEVNDMLCEVIRPFVNKLSAYGVLPRRDFNSFSPCELLKSRESFRQAPPQNLAQVKYGEVEGNFTVLLTLYHIKKLLSSHGIRPAFDMLDDKLQTGSLARFMSKNEALWKVKVLMQQRLSSGVLGPKLLKMLEVLVDHFKNRDVKESRVIIFSNFRGSVRDILNALGEIGDIVKATEFIGQSSGKALKGQSQKVQQAVLEKFRAGEYNVIVATSIGEEGLDIMEVDLVLCFDANISPLRMIQRMGRTGRNSKGRVVVLCYEGPELNGYKQKKQRGNSIVKHMKNGGTASFDFHSSPRMVPHIFKPEVQVVQLEIEEYHRHGKKPRDDQAAQTPISIPKLTDAENNLIEKYFDRVENNNTRRPSLIAFPHFQAIPSRVHKVKHSFRTGMLIDAMQHLQESIFSSDRKESSLQVEDKGTSDWCLGVETSELHDDHMKDLQFSQDSPVKDSPRSISESDDIQIQNPPKHSYLFGSDFVSVDTLGNVLIQSVPSLPLTKDSLSKCTTQNITESHNCYTTGDPLDDGVNITLDDVANRIIDDVPNRTPMKVIDELNDDEFTDYDFSPRLTNFIKSGVVPESPIDNTGCLEFEEHWTKGRTRLAERIVCR